MCPWGLQGHGAHLVTPWHEPPGPQHAPSFSWCLWTSDENLLDMMGSSTHQHPGAFGRHTPLSSLVGLPKRAGLCQGTPCAGGRCTATATGLSASTTDILTCIEIT